MSVPSVPFWWSAANAEYRANGWCSNGLAIAGHPAPRWLSEVAGTTYVEYFRMPDGQHGSINAASYVPFAPGHVYHITIPGSALYIGDNISTPAFICNYGAASITLVVEGGARIWGRGGNGGGVTAPGSNAIVQPTDGGPGMYLSGNVNLQNSGSISGGGGGGSTANSGSPSANQVAGGGGAPYGSAGQWRDRWKGSRGAQNAGLTNGGSGEAADAPKFGGGIGGGVGGVATEAGHSNDAGYRSRRGNPGPAVVRV